MPDEWREIIADWKGDGAFVARNSTGGAVQVGTINGIPGIGSMQCLLVGLAGCTGGDVASILLKKRQSLVDLQVRVRAKMRDEFPKIFTDIEVTFLLWGEELDPKAIEQAIQLSEDKYCSVGAMLRASASLKYHYIVLAPGEEPIENEEEIVS